MATQLVPLNELDVIGYADVLPDGRGPAVVPPVFRHRAQSDKCYVPPFRIAGSGLLEPKVVSFQEMQDLERDESLTLPRDFKHLARPDHQLWVDETGAVHYEPLAEARRNLNQIYYKHLTAAASSLHEGRLEKARKLAGVALAANDRALEPIALIAAYHVLSGEAAQAAFMRKSAEQAGLNGDTFLEKAKTYLESIPPETWQKTRLNVELVVETAKQLGIEVWIPFRLSEEEFRRFEPILHHYSRRGDERARVVSCPGVEAILLSERETLWVAYGNAERHIAQFQRTNVFAVAAETMVHGATEIAELCQKETGLIQRLGRQLRQQVHPVSQV